MSNKSNKIISILLILCIIGINLITLMGNFTISYAIDNEIEEVKKAYEDDINISYGSSKATKYHIAEKYGIVLQTNILIDINNISNFDDNIKLNIKVPKLGENSPNYLTVFEKNSLEQENNNLYSTEQDTIELKLIGEKNSAENTLKSEYVLNFFYEGEEIYSINEINSNINSKIIANELENNNQIIEKNIENTIEISEFGNILTDAQLNVENEISKGNLYANILQQKDFSTNFSAKYSINIIDKDIMNKIEIIEEDGKFLDENNEEIKLNNLLSNKNLKISSAVFEKMLGEDGIILIKNKEDEELSRIDKNTNKDDNNNYVLDISSFDKNIKIETSTIQNIGNYEIEIEKELKNNSNISLNEIKQIKQLQINSKIITQDELSLTKNILLKEQETVASIEIDRKNLSSVIKNENVEIRVILDTSTTSNALFDNPTLKIQLPESISELSIKNANILMHNGLKIKKAEVKKEEGRNYIYITLEGTQKDYTINNQYKGTTIILNTDITVYNLAPSMTDKITLEYTNKNALAQNNTGKVSTDVKIVSPSGIILANSISDYMENKNEVLALSGENKEIEIEAYSNSRTATVKGKIINNYSNDISNISVLGKFPTTNNNEIDGNEKLEATFTAKVVEGIKLDNIDEKNYKVYYTENSSATKDLTDANNKWTENITNNTKAYLIVFNDYTLKQGENIDFTYKIEIPNNLKYSQNTSQMFKTYYINESIVGNKIEEKESALLKLTTGIGPDLSVELKSTVNEIREGQIVKYNAIIKNIGSVISNNTNITINLPEGSTFTEYAPGNGFYDESINSKTLEVGKLDLNETKEIEFYVQYGMLSSDKYPVNAKIETKLKSDELENTEITSTFDTQINEGNIALKLISNVPETNILTKNDTIQYKNILKNISENPSIDSVNVNLPLPKGLICESATIEDGRTGEETTEGIVYDENTNNVLIKIDKIDKFKYITVNTKINEDMDEISIIADANINGNEITYSNISEHKVAKAELEVSELTSTPKYVKEGELITYKINIKNKGLATAQNVNIVSQVPEGLEFEKAIYTYGENNTEVLITNLSEGKINILIPYLESEESSEVTIIVKANLLNSKDDKEIKNDVSIYAENISEIKSNVVTNIVEYDPDRHQTTGDGGEENPDPENPDPENPTNPDQRFKISGTAWVDANKNGKREDGEELLSNISVILLNSNNEIVKDKETNEEKRTTTNNEGKYEFQNLEKGEYIVVFLYDSSKYSVTDYKAKGVSDSLNSDVIVMNSEITGERRLVAISDEIKITNSNVRDIDIGLYLSQKFDLSLAKYVNKITLTTPTIGTKTYSYNKEQLTKIEVLERNVGNSDIVIEYKIIIKNEGEISGYAKKIVDYLPEDVKFSTDLNTDWYLSNTGEIYNTSLENEIINPGEEKEVNLIVSMKITEDTLGILENNAEIYEAYNPIGVDDIDSTPGNKKETEDDISKAEILVGIVTGEPIFYITITIGVATIIGLGVYGIKKKILRKSNSLIRRGKI